MKKANSGLFRLLFFVLALLCLIIAINTMRFSTKQIAVVPIPKIAINQQASDRFRIHRIDERISLDGYENAIRFYLQLIKNSTV